MRAGRLSRAERKARIAAGETELRRKRGSFHRGEVVNYQPNREDYQSDRFLPDYLLKGWTPAEPVLTKGMKITAFGSCFAANITRHLSNIGYNLSNDRDPDVYISRLGDGMVNTASILGQFEWALENKKQAENLWHDYRAEGYGYDEDIRLRTRDIFLGTEFFIITLGLSEIWFDSETGGTFWRAVPEEAFNPERHKFRVMSFAETKADIERIHTLIRTHVPNAKILFTVSPIALAATFRDVSCLTANAASKAILRAALDEFLREHKDELNRSLFYFPSMEIVQLGFDYPWEADNRHPHSYVLDTVMKVFEATYCEGAATLDDAAETFQMYRLKNRMEFSRAVEMDGEEGEMLRAAKAANRAGKLERRKAKQDEAILQLDGARTHKEGNMAGNLDTDRMALQALRMEKQAKVSNRRSALEVAAHSLGPGATPKQITDLAQEFLAWIEAE